MVSGWNKAEGEFKLFKEIEMRETTASRGSGGEAEDSDDNFEDEDEWAIFFVEIYFEKFYLIVNFSLIGLILKHCSHNLLFVGNFFCYGVLN